MVLESRTHTGRRGEQVAEARLIDLGFEILERNWRWQHREIDLIARREDTVVFVEVKCRSGCGELHDSSEWMPSLGQQRRIVRAAHVYQNRNGLRDVCARFDVILVCHSSERMSVQTHFQHAFDASSTHPCARHASVNWSSAVSQRKPCR